MAVNFVLQVNNNRKSDYYGQQVARVKLLGNIDTDKVAEIIQRNASVKRSDVKAVLAELAEVITDQLEAGFAVKLDGIGSFSPRMRAKYQEVTDEEPPHAV